MRRSALIALLLLFTTYFAFACSQSPTTIPTIAYPETKRVDVVEQPFEQTVSDLAPNNLIAPLAPKAIAVHQKLA
jgi:prolyl oligopeptidase